MREDCGEDGVTTVMKDEERGMLRKYGEIFLYTTLDGASCREVVQDFRILMNEGVTNIKLIINSPGGSVEYGVGIIKVIREAQGMNIHVTGIVHGQAMSMAFLILQYCDERIMGELDVLMAHGFTAISIGDLKNIDAGTKLMKYWIKKFAEKLESLSTGKKYTVNYWSGIFKDQTPALFFADECLEVGLIDKVE